MNRRARVKPDSAQDGSKENITCSRDMEQRADKGTSNKSRFYLNNFMF